MVCKQCQGTFLPHIHNAFRMNTHLWCFLPPDFFQLPAASSVLVDSHFQSMGLTYFIHFCQLLKIIPLKLPLLSYILFSWIPFACSLFNSYNTAFNDCRTLSENHVPSSFNTSIRIPSFSN